MSEKDKKEKKQPQQEAPAEETAAENAAPAEEAAAEKTFRKRQVKASSKSPTGRAFSTMRRGCARKTMSTLRRLLGWVQRQSRV